jgi:hypothetical protein
MLVEQNGHILPCRISYDDLSRHENCYAESYEKMLLIEQYRHRIENGQGIFEDPPLDEEPLLEIDESILHDKKFRRTIFAVIRKMKKATLAQVRERLNYKYTQTVLQYFFDYCVENKLLFIREVQNRNKQKICYYHLRQRQCKQP